MKNGLIIISAILFLVGCQKEEISEGKSISNTFYVQNEGAAMRVLVEGNIASKTVLLFVHGGPGSSSYFYNSEYISNNIEDKYAVAYWDQRDAGASQGGVNEEQHTLKTMTTDLKKVIQVLKSRYGKEVNVFMLGHSFGGMLSASFVTTENYQEMIKGWIMFSGAHNYPLNDELTKTGLIYYAEQQIAQKKKVSEWTEILNFCKSITSGKVTGEQSAKLNTYATDTEAYFEEVKPYSIVNIVKENAVKQKYAITSTFFNLSYSQSSKINIELFDYELSSKLSKVTIPVLTMYGKYDLICPPKLGDDVFNNISSKIKSQVILPNSSHGGMLQDEELFCAEVNNFIKKNQ
jgi:pimeloyl-ACP methyl ester carboxylesterase